MTEFDPAPQATTDDRPADLRAGAFQGVREARRNELAEDYVELISDLLATTGEKRSRFAPTVATFSEQGFKEVVLDDWFGFFLPASTPAAKVDALNAALRSALGNPDFCALARAYGHAAERVEATAGFEPALARALAHSGSTVIELMLDADVITTRGTLASIREAALARLGQA